MADFHRADYVKPDGRYLALYGRRPFTVTSDIAATLARGAATAAHLRWHPLRGEWVAYAGHRQERTFLPSADVNPLAPSSDPARPTELPAGDYDVAVFENRFPSLLAQPGDPPANIVAVRPGHGACEMVVYSQDPNASLGALPLEHIELVIEVWADRTRVLGGRAEIEYVMPFENRGVEVGATLFHPHGQIYAYPFVPPVAARELEQQGAWLDAHRRGLLEDLIAAEIEDGRRMLYLDDVVAAFVPACARYPYEVWIAPRRAVAGLLDLGDDGRAAMARALKTVLGQYDGLWSRPFPYVMVIHQAPLDGRAWPEAHLHFEFYPPLRMPNRLKYLAGTELGAGMFASDRLPEETAAELRAVEE